MIPARRCVGSVPRALTRPPVRLSAVLLAAALAGAASAPLAAQAKAEKPLESEAFAAAVERGTRTQTGVPGPKYWQQYARYQLEAQVNPLSKRLTGRSTAVYENRSPDTLASIYVHLYANLFEEGAKANSDVTRLGGIVLGKVTAEGKPLARMERRGKEPGYRIDGTVAELTLAQPLAPGASVTLTFEWSLRIQPDGAPRGGQDGEVWYLSYWYPQFAVYDDVNGWQVDQYLGTGEFYMGYADYDVAITVPAGWLVQATGALQNGEEVLAAPVRERLEQARHSGSVVHVVTADDRGAGTATTAGRDGLLTWRFAAKHVRDVAFGASGRYLWDAVAVEVGDANGDGRPDSTLAQAFYRPEAARWFWGASASYVKHAVGFYSKLLWPYPWPHMTAVEGPLSCGGMEYPMLTCIGARGDSMRQYITHAHEIAHMWFPMMVGSDEKRNAWQDEGFAQYLEGQAAKDYAPGNDDEKQSIGFYQVYARQGRKEAPMLTHADKFPSDNAYAIGAYFKPAAAFAALRLLLGADTFHGALRTYGERWMYKHPQPEDFFYAVQDVSKQDLQWFWRAWFAGTGKLDIALDTVIVGGDSAAIVLQNRGRLTMPTPLLITRADGTTERVVAPAGPWLDGERKNVFVVRGASAVQRVQVDPDQQLPYIDRTRLDWRK